MLISKLTSWKVLPLIASLLASGCFLKPREQSDVEESVRRHHQEQQNATFYIGRATTGTSYDHKSVEGWSVPEIKYYNLRACLSDRVTNDRIIGHKFEVLENINSQGQLATTDDEGCLHWDEYIPFNYFSQTAHYLTIERYIKGVGIHSGQIKVTLAINPWHNSRGGNTPEIVDLARSSLPQNQRLNLSATQDFMTTQYDQRLQVEVKDLSVTINSRQARQDGSELDIQLSMTPQVILTNIFGDKVIHRIRRGEFDVYFQIVANSTRDEKSELFLISDMMVASSSNKNQNDQAIIQFQDDKIDVRFQTLVQNRITHGHYDLVLRLVPRNIHNLDDFFAVYRFSESHSLIASRGGLRPMISSFEDKSAATQFETLLDLAKREQNYAGDIRKLEPFDFDHQRISFMRVLPDETTTKRSIAYRSEVCIRRAIDGRLVQYEDFTIKKADGSTSVVNSQSQGCIAWVDTITHQYYHPETIMKQTALLTHVQSGYQKEMSAYINPWDYGWTFGQDAEKIPLEYIEDVNNRRASSSQIFISGYNYQTIRFRYDIDKFLNLNVKKTLLLDISPRVLRYHSITRGRNATEPLRDGVYLMKVAIQRDYFDPRTPGLSVKTHDTIPGKIEVENSHNKEVEFINTVQKLVRVKHGRIITPVELSVNDLRLMRVRSNFLIEMSAVDEARMGITPDTNMATLDIEGLISSAEGMSMDERTNPRRFETASPLTTQNYVMENQYFSDAPYNISNAEISNLMVEENNLARIASRTVNFDQFIDPNSGLPTRTFVGPIILLSNAFGAGLRPTDELEEDSDCDKYLGEERQNCLASMESSDAIIFDNNPQVARFYGSAKHLENVSVTELEERSKKIQLEYENQQTYESLLSRYSKEYYLDYISLNGTPLKVFPIDDLAQKIIYEDEDINSFTDLALKTCGSENLSDCLIEQEPNTPTTKEILLDKLNLKRSENLSLYYGAPFSFNHQRLPEFTESDLKNFIRSETEDSTMAERLCHVFIDYMMTERNGFDLLEEERKPRGLFSNSPITVFQIAQSHCIRMAQRDLENVFHISRKLKPSAVEGYRFRGGKSMNFNVGANFNMRFDEGLSSSLDFGIDPMALLKNIGGVVGSLAGVFSLKTGSRASISRSLGQGTSINSGTYLAMQQASMELFFDQYESCIEIRMHKDFLSHSNLTRARDLLPQDKQMEAISQGIFICTGETVRERKAFPEWYYYFTQHFTEGDMLDNGDLLNHPWLLALRGERNYSHFINLIKATPQTDRQSQDFDLRWLPNHMLQHYLDNPEMVNTIPTEVNLGERPLNQLIEAYNMMPPTFPGLYTIRPKKLDYPQ